ncbi:hypothetical protein [Domibacillus mangrovi]|uniref:Uncharacterized protein n=1 Tax=Domibacillus mangrovi TaxID=1714354 RepID=A0A1Q5P5U6_9BACI|nr:hypothetical protein [Domibacillus mangrovi]OKL37604.1 hypothetical protein BLL40_04680 [Domibacillus mangrovi]
MRRKKYDAPVLLGIERGTKGYMAVWCPYCVDFHLHGQEEGHVVAHCIDPESPFNSTGYYIKKIKYAGKRVILENGK